MRKLLTMASFRVFSTFHVYDTFARIENGTSFERQCQARDYQVHNPGFVSSR